MEIESLGEWLGQRPELLVVGKYDEGLGSYLPVSDVLSGSVCPDIVDRQTQTSYVITRN